MYHPLTKRQKEILDFIKIFSQLNGYAPTLTDIKNHFQLSAVSTVHEHIQNLKDKGYIDQEVNQARSIKALDQDDTSSHNFEIPILSVFTHGQPLQKNEQHQVIVLSKNELPKQARFLAINCGADNLIKHGIKHKDTLILQSYLNQDPAEGNLVLIKDNKDVHFLSNFQSKKKVLDLNTNHEYTKFEIVGILHKLVRNY